MARIETSRMGAPQPMQYGTTSAEECGACTQWIWTPSDVGPRVLATFPVACRGEMHDGLARVSPEGLLCIEGNPSSDPEHFPASGCYRVEDGGLVLTGEHPLRPIPRVPHPWAKLETLPLPSLSVVEAAEAEVRSKVAACLRPSARVSVRIRYPGDGRAHDPDILRSSAPVDAGARTCVLKAIDEIRHPPFRGRIVHIVNFP
jgi:hypothetical protein